MEKIYLDVNHLPKRRKLSLSLGNFDGFHIGHSSLAFEAFTKATYENAILFFSIPYKSFYYHDSLLTSLDTKLFLAEQNRYETAYILSSTSEVFALSQSQFEGLLKELGVEEIFVGTDYRYGKAALGTPTTLKEAGFIVHECPLLEVEGEKVASTGIKRYLEYGDVEKATSLLGRPYEICGTVIHGRKVGRTMGYPTANLELEENYCIPAPGVYAGRAYVRGIPHFSMISIGNNPTFNIGEALHIEAHLFDFDEEIYGERIYLDFFHRLREARRFPDVESLIKQLQKDEEESRLYFASLR